MRTFPSVVLSTRSASKDLHSRGQKSTLRLAMVALLGVAVSGCYRYVPSGAVQPVGGDEVRLTLSTDGSVRMTPVLGERTKSLTGRILSDGAIDLTLAVDRTFKEDSVAVVWTGERVTIPRNAIANTERRVLDRKQTLLTTVAILASATASAFVLSRTRAGGGGNGGDGPPPPPP